MVERRQGSLDRRASKRGGRRISDQMRSDTDTLRLRWEGLEIPDSASPAINRLPDDDDTLADPVRFGNVRRALVPPRK